jgi:ubiquinone/menaquinone biosynthesis C-methylase UbiE
MQVGLEHSAETMPIALTDVPEEQARVLESFFVLFGTNQPSLRQLWAAMDFVWDSLDCDNKAPNPERLAAFYRHPIWLLNGLFGEHHYESRRHREEFSDWAQSQAPGRVADFGGGFGTLARMIARKCRQTQVEIVEPFPSATAIARLECLTNTRYVSVLDGPYDVILATDVFEHVPDPLATLFDVVSHLKIGGRILVANHFAPAIKCHLPQTFHFLYTWHAFMRMAGCKAERPVSYGWTYVRVRDARLTAAIRRWEASSRLSNRVARRSPALARAVERGCLKWSSATSA